MPDVHHPLPRIKNVVVFDVVVNGDVLAGSQFGFDGGDVVIRADFAGFWVFLIRVLDDENVQSIRFQAAPDQVDELVQNAGFVGGQDFLLKAQGHAAIGLGKLGRLNESAGLAGIAEQDLGGGVPHLIRNRCQPTLERFENH